MPWSMLAGGLFSALPSIIGAFQDPYRNTQQPTNINPMTDQAWNQIQEQNTNLNNWFQRSLGDSRTAGQGDFGASRNMLSQLSNMSFDPQAANRAFMSQVPEFQNLVRSSIGDSSSEQELARMRSIVGEEAASRFGGSPTSAAFQQSVMRATAEPGLQYMMNRENLQSQMLGNLLNQNLGQMNQGFWNQAQFGANNLGSAAQGMSNLGNTALQSELARMSQLGSMLGQNMNLIGQFGQPTLWSPDMVTNPNFASGGDVMSNLASGANLGMNIDRWLTGRGGSSPQQSFSGSR